MVNTGDEGIKNKFFYDLKSLFPLEPEVEDGLVQGFQNIGLESNGSDTCSEDINELSSGGDDSIGNLNMKPPIRSDAEDCSFFIRTGTCKFGPTCKFNHPKIASQIPCKVIGIPLIMNSPTGETSSVSEKLHGAFLRNFYLTGPCKYGESCRFKHSKSEADKSALQFNFLGFPKRLGKINCSFYMRTGMCDYGASCRFHHPDPIFVLEPEMYASAVIGEPMNNYKEDSESTQSHLSLPLMTHGSLHIVYQSCVLSGYQASECKQEVEMVEYYSEDHPPCVLNDVGLPIRPGKKVCWNYEKLGLCKMGRACAFDHPKKHSSTDGSTSESLSGGETHK